MIIYMRINRLCPLHMCIVVHVVGEDGAVKIWSKTGMLRTVLIQNGMCACIKCTNASVLYKVK